MKRSPFGNGPQLIMHATHHKMGTVWMMRVLEAVADRYGLTFQKSNKVGDIVDPDTQILFANHSQFSSEQLGDFVGSHMVRDPRDCIVSGYYYHLWTDEAWAHVPEPQYEGLSYQQYLKSVDQDTGVSAEITRFARYVEDYRMRFWNYEDDRIFEMKYEELLGNEKELFNELFRHYGFTDKAVRMCVKIAERFSFKNLAGQSVGVSTAQKHLRDGRPGQWKEVLTDRHLAAIEDLFGDLLVYQGYVIS